jgi:hypothetical protein
MGVFGRLLNLGSLQCPHASLVYHQIFLPIFSKRVGFISSKVIVLVAYLGSWAFGALITVSKFLVNFHLFLLVAIDANNLGSLSFQAVM